MSIFLKPGMVKVRQEDDEFSEINILAESSSQAYLDAIQAKGEEVLESIPSEYSDLVEEVDGKLDSPQTAGTSGQVLTSDGQGGQSWETHASDAVTDVQIGGTSILDNGVANIPKANTSTYGAVQLDTYGGLQIGSNGKIKIDPASSVNIKASTDPNKPIVSSHQHESAFYGLAKAAGDSTQSASSNPVGTYTSEAKASIKNMLGVQVDSALSNSSTNPVENRVVKQAIDDIVMVSNSQPASPNNEIWIESDGDSVEIPTIDDVVQDVQINGNSITNDGIANIPLATGTIAGVAKFQGGFGIGINNSGLAYAYAASDNDIKNATDGYRPIVSLREHNATFYGLAKAAGDTTQSQSSDSVGTYTDEAKIAIQKMLGIYEAPWELIREDTVTNVTEADIIIDVDGNGNAFELTDIILLFETPKQSTESAKGQYGNISFYAGNSLVTQIECGSWTQAAEASSHGIIAIVKQDGSMLITSASAQTTTSNSASVRLRYGVGFDNTQQSVKYLTNKASFTAVNIIKVTGTGHYRLYGKRKWQ